MKLKEKPEESTLQRGNDLGMKQVMEELNLPYTRETYLELAYFGNVPEKLSDEEEEELPEEFQNK